MFTIKRHLSINVMREIVDKFFYDHPLLTLFLQLQYRSHFHLNRYRQTFWPYEKCSILIKQITLTLTTNQILTFGTFSSTPLIINCVLSPGHLWFIFRCLLQT